MAIAKESTLAGGLARQSDQQVQNGQVLFHSTFEHGFEGWRDHYDGTHPYPCVSLTSYPVMHGGHALMISTGGETYNAASAYNDASTYKNLSQFQVAGKKVSFSGFFAIGGEGGAFAAQAWGLMFDIQAWDNSWRSFFKLRCKDRNGQGSDASPPAWFVSVDGDGNNDLVIPGTGSKTAGENEHKLNFNYVRMTIDMAANNGQGGYYEAQINNQAFDLRNLGAAGAATPRPVEPPQAGSPIDSFAGGFNAGLGITRRWRTPSLGAAILYADDLLCTIED